MVTSDVHTWLWCDVPYHRGWWRALSTSIHDCDAVLRGTYVYHMENLLMTHCHWWQTGLHQRQKNLSQHTHTLTQTHHTHTLWHFHIYIEDSSNREDIIAIAICSECYVANAIAISSTTPSDSCMICEAGRLRSSWQVHTNVWHYTCTCNQGDLDL